jgi:hypothetical protein
MEVIKTTFIELKFRQLYGLDPDRPQYYGNVIRAAKDIMLYLEQEEMMMELELRIRKIEKRYRTSLKNLEQGYYNQRFYFNKKAWCRVGDAVEYRKVTRYEMFLSLEEIKDWIYDNMSILAQRVRFSVMQEVKA